MKLDVVNIQGDKTGRSADLADTVFGIEPNEHSYRFAPPDIKMHIDFSEILDSSVDLVISNHCLASHRHYVKRY